MQLKGAPDYFDPAIPIFWDENALEKEWRRVADICHGCRLCFNLCPAFPALFDSIDAADGDIAALTAATFDHVVDLCYECKLCYVKCPYTPPHEYQLDFPRLVLRSRAVRARRGVALQDRILGMTDAIGRLGSLTAPIFNWVNRFPPARLVMEKTVGIHRQWRLPTYHRETFTTWFARRQKPLQPGINGKAAFFATCSVTYNNPATGQAAVAVLEHNGVEVIVPPQRCCGMPYLDGGDLPRAIAAARDNVAWLAPYVQQGYAVVVPGPTCSYTIKQEYPLLLKTPEAYTVANHTYDLSEYLLRLHRAGKLNTAFTTQVGRIIYHVPCHLKAQNIGTPSVALLRLIPGAQVEVVERCSGVDGTWGMKAQYRDLALKVADKLLTRVREGQPALVVSDCPLAGLQMEQGAQVTTYHPMEILKRAYGL
jgi:Fe-S oxidoreductase